MCLHSQLYTTFVTNSLAEVFLSICRCLVNTIYLICIAWESSKTCTSTNLVESILSSGEISTTQLAASLSIHKEDVSVAYYLIINRTTGSVSQLVSLAAIAVGVHSILLAEVAVTEVNLLCRNLHLVIGRIEDSSVTTNVASLVLVVEVLCWLVPTPALIAVSQFVRARTLEDNRECTEGETVSTTITTVVTFGVLYVLYLPY